MKFLKAVKNFICYGSVYFTAITSFMLILVSDRTDKAPDTGRFLLFLMLSFIFALGSTLYRIDGISIPLAACLHAAIYNVGFLLFLALGNMGFAGSVIGTLIFAVVYTVITVVYRLISKKLNKPRPAPKTTAVDAPLPEKKGKKREKTNNNEKSEYKNLFS